MLKKIILVFFLFALMSACTRQSNSNVLIAMPEQTSSAVDVWGISVVQHQAKAGVYETFTSAHFGDAGRWMTTNLAAKGYDTNSTTATLSAAPSGEPDLYNPRWCYPSAISPSARAEYTANENLGLLYNWAAATATTQNNNTVDEAELSYGFRQGICPNGWHLPSDTEWTELENEFTAHKSKYSSLANDTNASNNGTAMRDITANGASKSATSGGFAALVAGYACDNTSGNIGSGGYFWNSSSYDSQSARFGNVNKAYGTMNRYYVKRYYLFSVRCKKD